LQKLRYKFPSAPREAWHILPVKVRSQKRNRSHCVASLALP